MTTTEQQTQPLNSSDFSGRVVDFLVRFVHPSQWRSAAPVLTTLLVDVSKDTAALASEAWREGIEQARTEAAA